MSDKKVITVNEPKSEIILMEIDSVSSIDEMNITLVSGTTATGKTVEFSIGTPFFEKIKADSWCIEGSLVRAVVEKRIADKTTYTDAAKVVHFHTKDGVTCNRMSKGSKSTWTKSLEDSKQARQQGAKSANAEKALDLLSSAVEKGLSETAAAQLIGQIMS